MNSRINYILYIHPTLGFYSSGFPLGNDKIKNPKVGFLLSSSCIKSVSKMALGSIVLVVLCDFCVTLFSLWEILPRA